MKNEHIRHGVLADLFLDTYIMGWSADDNTSLGEDSYKGGWFSATGIGEEMIVGSMKEYEEKAVALTHKPLYKHYYRLWLAHLNHFLELYYQPKYPFLEAILIVGTFCSIG